MRTIDADLLAALRLADQWIKLLVEEMEIDPSETTVTVSAVGPDAKRELAQMNLEVSQSQIANAIAKAEAA